MNHFGKRTEVKNLAVASSTVQFIPLPQADMDGTIVSSITTNFITGTGTKFKGNFEPNDFIYLNHGATTREFAKVLKVMDDELLEITAPTAVAAAGLSSFSKINAAEVSEFQVIFSGGAGTLQGASWPSGVLVRLENEAGFDPIKIECSGGITANVLYEIPASYV